MPGDGKDQEDSPDFSQAEHAERGICGKREQLKTAACILPASGV